MSTVPDAIRTCGSGTTKCTRMVQCCPKNTVDPRIRWIPMVDHHISSLSPAKLPSIGGPLMSTAAPRRCTKASHDTRTALLQETRPPKPGFQALSRTSLLTRDPCPRFFIIILHHSLHHSQFFCIILSILLHRHSQIPQNFHFSKGVRLHRPGARIDRSQHLRLAADPT